MVEEISQQLPESPVTSFTYAVNEIDICLAKICSKMSTLFRVTFCLTMLLNLCVRVDMTQKSLTARVRYNNNRSNGELKNPVVKISENARAAICGQGSRMGPNGKCGSNNDMPNVGGCTNCSQMFASKHVVQKQIINQIVHQIVENNKQDDEDGAKDSSDSKERDRLVVRIKNRSAEEAQQGGGRRYARHRDHVNIDYSDKKHRQRRKHHGTPVYKGEPIFSRSDIDDDDVSEQNYVEIDEVSSADRRRDESSSSSGSSQEDESSVSSKSHRHRKSHHHHHHHRR